MTALNVYIPALKREVAGPGNFDTDFPNSDDGDLLGRLGDGFGQAQMDGFFGTQTLDLTTYIVTPDLSLAGAQMCVLYAAERVLQLKLISTSTNTVYKAGGVEYQTQGSAGAVTALIKDLATRRENILKQVLRAGRATNAIHVTDGYLIRSQGYFPYGTWGEFGGFFGYEIGGLGGTFSGLLF